tara:strand:+ start:2849 stop:3376 length:528 start_codon:yes stop_codon:yes gene_type:complete
MNKRIFIVKSGFFVTTAIIIAFLCSQNISAKPTENTNLEKQFIGMWRLVSWEKEYTDGSVKPEPRSKSYIIYTDTGHMCWVATDPNRTIWTGKPTQEQKAEAFDGLGFYCAVVELNVDKGYVIHHLELARSQNAVGINLKRWFSFDGKDRLLLRVEPSENEPPLVESRLVWERVK